MKTLENCFKNKIDKELSIFVDTVEGKIENAISTAIDSFVAPKTELPITSINAPSGGDATRVVANSERGEQIGITARFENVSEKDNTLQVLNVIDETWNKIPVEISELSVPGTLYDRQSHTHHMVTGQTAQTNQIPEFLTVRILTQRNQTSHQHQNLSTQVSQDNNLRVVEQTLTNEKWDAINSNKRLP